MRAALEDAIGAEILWHQSEARQHRNAEHELREVAPEESWQHGRDAAMHEDHAGRLQAILYPPAPPSPEPEIAF